MGDNRNRRLLTFLACRKQPANRQSPMSWIIMVVVMMSSLPASSLPTSPGPCAASPQQLGSHARRSFLPGAAATTTPQPRPNHLTAHHDTTHIHHRNQYCNHHHRQSALCQAARVVACGAAARCCVLLCCCTPPALPATVGPPSIFSIPPLLFLRGQPRFPCHHCRSPSLRTRTSAAYRCRSTWQPRGKMLAGSGTMCRWFV